MKAVFGIPVTWLSEISHCDESKRFVYEQRIGPFKFWSHEVCLTETQNGIVLEDITYIQLISAIDNHRTWRRLADIVSGFFQSDQR